MNNKKSFILVIVLLLACIFGLFGDKIESFFNKIDNQNALADEINGSYGYLLYTIYDEKYDADDCAVITGCDAAVEGEIEIPSKIEGYPVISISSDSFSNCSGLTSVIIPDSITSIGASAFANCTSLTSVRWGDSVTSIGNSVFYNCVSLKSITIPDKLEKIPAWAFEDCTALASITLPSGIEEIEMSAFEGCSSLTHATIPDSVKIFGMNAFEYCNNLENIYYSGTQEQWNEIDFFTDADDNYCLDSVTIHFNS